MAEYIEREAVIEYLLRCADGYQYIETPTQSAVDAVRNIPAADVRPVVRGEWRLTVVDDHSVLACSECGSIIATDHAIDYLEKEDNKFCYWCGADMQGDAK